MTENEAKESAQEVQEQVEQPIQPVASVPSVVEPTSAPVERVDDVTRLEEMIDRKVQSLKDRRLAKVDVLAEKVEELISLYEGQPQASEVVAESVVGTKVSGDQTYMVEMSTEILSAADIPVDDPEYQDMVQRNQGKITNPEQWIGLTREFANRRVTKGVKQETAGQTAVAGSPGGVAGGQQREAEEVAAELARYQSGEFGSLTNPEVQKKRRELKEELNKLAPRDDSVRPLMTG